jgi:hypothetical protein
MAVGLFYNDLLPPFMAADQAAVTLSTTNKALYTASASPYYGPQFWSVVGRKVRLRAFGKITTAATPGTGTFGLYYGSGADATGVLLASSAALTLVASQTNISWEIELFISARTLGSAGTLFVDGHGFFGTAVVAAGFFLMPASAAVASGACDLTAANILSLQFLRSGSTAETMTVQDLDIVAMN